MTAAPSASETEPRRALVAVTGAGGFLGSAVAAHLRSLGHPVVRLARDAPPAATDPVASTRLLPASDAPDEAFRRALEGVGHVVHCAALNSDRSSDREALFSANAVLAGRLAQAAAAVVPGRFVFLSSIRAVAGPGFSGVIDEATPARPVDEYGRSKLAGEQRVAEAYRASQHGCAAILRLAPVYGRGMRGNLALLARLAATPYWLPLAAVATRRSLLELDAACRAVAFLLTPCEGPRLETYVVSDASPVSLAEIVASLRTGFGRPARLFALPPFILRGGLAVLGKHDAWARLAAAQRCDASRLAAAGWQNCPDTPAALRDLARRIAAG